MDKIAGHPPAPVPSSLDHRLPEEAAADGIVTAPIPNQPVEPLRAAA